jgi:predicted esterase
MASAIFLPGAPPAQRVRAPFPRFIRSPENAERLGIDPTRVAIGGHSMGGWVTAETLAHDSNLLGAVIISAGDFGAIGLRAQQNRVAVER